MVSPKRLAVLALLLPVSCASLFAQQQPYYPGPQQPYSQYDSGQQYPQPQAGGYAPQQSGYAQPQGLASAQLEQLVAPIALNPDPLVALMLAASTYPQQIADADRWRQSQGNAPPDQIAYGADLQNWDPSVKALTAFPQVLAEMDQDMQWTSALGNAYYNQPQDVLQAIQVMRQRAQGAGNLQTTPQQVVTDNAGYIQVAPANPQVVYVPAYNPWTAYGQPVAPYPGFSLFSALGSFFNSSFGSSAVQFGLGMVMSAFNHSPWGLLSWGLNWLTQNLLFHNSNYFSSSPTVADWGLRYGGPRAYMAPHRSFVSYNRGYGYGQNYNRGYSQPRSAYNNTWPRTNSSRGYQTSQYNYNRNSQPQSFIRPAYDTRYNAEIQSSNGFAGREQSPFANHSAYTTAQNYNSYRAPSSSFNRGQYGQQPYSGSRNGSYSGNSFMNSSRDSSHFFGNGHNSGIGHAESFKAPKYKAPKAPSFKAPKAPKMHGGGGGGSHHSSGGSHHSGGGHR